MDDNLRFLPGQHIVIRERWEEKISSARPSILVEDSAEMIACYIMPGSQWKTPRSASGERLSPVQRAQRGWVLRDATWLDISLLRLSIPGQRYSVLIFRDSLGVMLRWYINLEAPLTRSRLGFDCYDSILDAIVAPDLSSWHWEDEDELEEAISAGLVSKEEADALYAEGERAVDFLRSGKSPFNGWENWRPDPSWAVPILPFGWDTI